MRQSQNKNIEILFKKLLGKAEVKPSEDIWDKIETQLPQNQLFSTYTKSVLGFGLLVVFSFSIYQITKVEHYKSKDNNIVLEKGELSASKQSNNGLEKRNFYTTKKDFVPKNVDINDGKIKKDFDNSKNLLEVAHNFKLPSKSEKLAFLSHEKPKDESNLKDKFSTNKLDEKNSELHLWTQNNRKEIENKPNYQIVGKEFEHQNITIHDIHPISELALNEDLKNEIIFNNPKINETKSLETIDLSKINLENERLNPESMWSENEGLMQKSAGIDEVDPLTLRRLKNKVNFDKVNVNKGFYIGPYVGVNYTWLSVSKKYQDKDYRVENVKYNFSFGKSYGFSLGYDISKHWGVAADFGMATLNQTYFERPSDKIMNERSVRLNYWQLPIYVKYKCNIGNRLQHRPIVVGGLIGPQVTFLNSSKTIDNGVEKQINQRINQQEFGLAGIVDADFFINKNLFLTLGLKGSFGTNLSGFPRLQGPDKKDPISYQLGVFTRFNFRVSPKH